MATVAAVATDDPDVAETSVAGPGFLNFRLSVGYWQKVLRDIASRGEDFGRSDIGKGKKIEDILWGVHTSIASRSASLMRRVGIEDEITFTGGVSLNEGMVKALEDRLEMPLNISEDCHYMGALGAALFALDHVKAGRTPTKDKVEVTS